MNPLQWFLIKSANKVTFNRNDPPSESKWHKRIRSELIRFYLLLAATTDRSSYLPQPLSLEQKAICCSTWSSKSPGKNAEVFCTKEQLASLGISIDPASHRLRFLHGTRRKRKVKKQKWMQERPQGEPHLGEWDAQSQDYFWTKGIESVQISATMVQNVVVLECKLGLRTPGVRLMSSISAWIVLPESIALPHIWPCDSTGSDSLLYQMWLYIFLAKLCGVLGLVHIRRDTTS